MTNLNGKSIIITGGASGIGEAAALIAASRGARVTIADLDEAGGERVAAEINNSSGEAVFVRTDISDEEQVQRLVDTSVSRFGALHGAFNNAGITAFSYQGGGNPLSKFADLSTKEFQRNISINVLGTFLCMRYEILAMLKTGGGAIVNTASTAGILALAAAADYVASKHAVIGLTKAAALDYATDGIRVNAVVPCAIKTPMMDRGFGNHPHLHEWAAEAQPNKRLGLPSEIAEAALWLLSDAASLVTGTSLAADGGFSIV